MLKKLKWIAIAVVLLVIVGVVVLVANLNGIVRNTVEVAGSKGLNLPTTLGGVNIGLLSGNVSLSELGVGSPQGFDAPQMFSLGGISVDTSYPKLLGSPVQVNDITIERPRLVIEQKNLKTNLQALTGQLGGGTPPTVPEPQQPAPEPAAGGTKVIIDQLKVDSAEVVLRPNLPGLKPEYVLKVPTFELKNIGNADGARNGEEIGRVVKELVARIANDAVKSNDFPPELEAFKGLVAGDLQNLVDNIGGQIQQQLSAELAGIKDQAKAQVDQLKQQAGEVAGQVKEQAGQAVQGATDTLKEEGKKLQEGLGGLLGGGKKEEEKKP